MERSLQKSIVPVESKKNALISEGASGKTKEIEHHQPRRIMLGTTLLRYLSLMSLSTPCSLYVSFVIWGRKGGRRMDKKIMVHFP